MRVRLKLHNGVRLGRPVASPPGSKRISHSRIDMLVLRRPVDPDGNLKKNRVVFLHPCPHSYLPSPFLPWQNFGDRAPVRFASASFIPTDGRETNTASGIRPNNGRSHSSTTNKSSIAQVGGFSFHAAGLTDFSSSGIRGRLWRTTTGWP